MHSRRMGGPILLILLAGCISTPPGENVPTITDPSDYSYLDDEEQRSKGHVHDYWGDRDSVTLLEQEVELTSTSRPGVRVGTRVELPEGSLFFPGTRWVNGTVTWPSQAVPPPPVMIQYIAADNTNATVRFTAPGSFSIDVSETMNDPPHATDTVWTWTAMVDQPGKVKAKIVIEIKRTPGPLPIAPPHPDLWGTDRSLIRFERSGQLKDLARAGGTPWPGAQPSGYHYPLKPFPPFTKKAVVTFFYNSTTPAGLHYSPVLSWIAKNKIKPYAEDVAPTKSDPRNSNGVFQWEFAYEPKMWDSPYAQNSRWLFFVDWAGKDGTQPTYVDGNFHTQVSAVRE
jgi:hypothetical protein